MNVLNAEFLTQINLSHKQNVLFDGTLYSIYVQSWHFFGREWDYGRYYSNRKNFREFGSTSNEDKAYDSDVLDFNYAYFNLLPTEPVYVMTLSDDLASENFAAQVLNQDLEAAHSANNITEDKRFYEGVESDEGRYTQNATVTLTRLQKNIDNMILFNPAREKYDEDKAGLPN